MVQTKISFDALAKANYTSGTLFDNHLIRILSYDEWGTYVAKGTLNGKIALQDENVWHKLTEIPAEEGIRICTPFNVKYYSEWSSSYGSSDLLYFIFRKDHKCMDTVYQCYDLYQGSKGLVRRVCESNRYLLDYPYSSISQFYIFCSFRPALEFVDNPKSTTIWY